MYSKKSEKRKKKKKMKKKPKKRIDKQITRVPGMFPSPIMGSNSIIYQPAPMPREDPVAQINIRNTEAVRNRLLLEQVTDLVAPQRKPETLVAPEQPTVAPSKPKMILNPIPEYRKEPKRSSSVPVPTARLKSGEKIELLLDKDIMNQPSVIIKKKKKERGRGRSPTKRRP
tara:strand:- start:637 stop:1149 length:513 start_codon:yes stop_codon:yes gene_type:complete